MAGTKQPSDKSHFILPDLGEGVHEAELIKWRVEPGEAVKEHQTMAEMETDKALVEVPSPWTGTISELCAKEGEIVKVGSVLVRYATSATAATKESAPATAKSAPTTSTKEGAEPRHIDVKAPAADSPASGGEREDAGTVVGNVSGTLSVSERFARRRDEHTAATATGKALATPAVRRIARELNVDINKIPGTGRGGRVTASDVDAHARDRGAVATGANGTSSNGGGRGGAVESGFAARAVAIPENRPPVSADGISQRIPFRGVRRKIAEALLHSVRTTVHFTAVEEADVTALDRKRREYANVLGQKLSFLPFVMMAICKGLRKHPMLNANVDDDNAEILVKDVINLGCAVDTDHGLMVPVIHGADRMSLVQLADAVKDLASRCHNRTVAREELQGGTFTITNVGSYGGMFATPIINYPEIGILAAGRAREKVLAKNGAIYVGTVLPLSISCDHRVIDGAEAVRFMNTVVKLLQDPEALLG